MREYGLKKVVEFVKVNFDREYLNELSERAQKDLEQFTQEVIDFQTAIIEQLKTIEATPVKTYIHLERFKNDHVQYTVRVLGLPQTPEILALDRTQDPEKLGYYFFQACRGYGETIKINGYEVHLPLEGNTWGEKFPGTERKAAFARAEELAKEHGAEIIKFGF
jgi:hypothetical protein